MAQIRLILRPGGPGCNHVHVNDTNGNRLRSYNLSDLRQAIRSDSEPDPLLVQIRRLARDSGLTDPAALKTHLEGRDFDL